jgi:hypothetical protein
MDGCGLFAMLEIPNVDQKMRKTSKLADPERKLQLHVQCANQKFISRVHRP